MSTTSQYTDFSDIYNALIQRVRGNTSDTTLIQLAKQFVNSAHKDIYIRNGEKFSWTERRATITTHAEYTTGTLTATQGSTTITGSSTAWNTADAFGTNNMQVGGKITIAGSEEVYEVTAVGSDTSATISPAFIDDDTSGATYVYFEDEYALATDFMKPIDARSFDTACRIPLLGRQDFRRRYPRNRITSQHIHAATWLDLPFSGDTTPVRKVRFAPPPSNAQIIPYTYVTKYIAVSSAGSEQEQLSADADEPTMPLRHRHLILLKALADFYQYKDDARWQQVRAEFEQLMARVVSDQDVGQQRARFTTHPGRYRARARSPYRRGGGRYDINDRFDRFID